MTNGVPIVAGNQIPGVIPAIHIYDPVRMRPSDIEDVDTLEFGHVDDLDPVGCDQLPRPTRGFAARMRLVAIDHTLRDRDRRHARDRKSTRLNSSHLVISYAVFC